MLQCYQEPAIDACLKLKALVVKCKALRFLNTSELMFRIPFKILAHKWGFSIFEIDFDHLKKS